MDKKPENYFDGTQFRLACHRCVGARDPCAGYSPPGGARGPCAGYSPPGGRAWPVRGLLTAGRCACPAGYSGLSGAIAPGADKPRQRPSARLTRGGSSDPSPYVIPTSAWRDRIRRTPKRLEGDRFTAPAREWSACKKRASRRASVTLPAGGRRCV